MPQKKPIIDDSPRRQAILAAALELFAERGFHGTAVPEVAERAKVGAGTVYRYFENKEALVNALFQHWKGEYGRFLLAGLPVGAPFRTLFHEAWRRMGEFARKHPKVVQFLELHHHGDYLDVKSHEAERQVLEPLKQFVEAAQAQRALRAGSPEILMTIVYGAFTGLLRASAQGFLTLSQQTLDEMEQCVWEAIRG
jgi:TetR/AcrR family transcriptional regulator, repressor of fatR-cypB operon